MSCGPIMLAPISADNTKQRLLEIAIELFRRHGYSGVSVRDIASAVGISPPALYNHFPNKKALYQAAVAAAFEDKAQRMLDVLDSGGPGMQRLDRFIHTTVTEIRCSPAFRALMDRELLDGDAERLEFLGQTVFARVQQPFMNLLDELKPGCDAFLLSEMILGMLKQHDAMVLLHAHLGVGMPVERDPDVIARQIMAVLTPYFSVKS